MFTWLAEWVLVATSARTNDTQTMYSYFAMTALILLLLLHYVDAAAFFQDALRHKQTVQQHRKQQPGLQQRGGGRRGRSATRSLHKQEGGAGQQKRAISQTRVTLAKLDEHGELTHVYSARNLQARFAGPTPGQPLTPEQARLKDEIVQSRPRTGMAGPFGPWLSVPSICGPAQALGKACRYNTSLSFMESELVILLTGAKTRSHAEFDIHVGEAMKAGMSMKLITSIPRDDDFSIRNVEERLVPLLSESGPRLVAIARFTAELLETCTVRTATYEATKAALGDEDSVLVEITSIAGYYTYVAYTLNVFQIPSTK